MAINNGCNFCDIKYFRVHHKRHNPCANKQFISSYSLYLPSSIPTPSPILAQLLQMCLVQPYCQNFRYTCIEHVQEWYLKLTG